MSTPPPPGSQAPRADTLPPELDDAIPMLTEIVALPSTAPATPEPETADGWADVDWTTLEQRIHERVTSRLVHHTQELLEPRLQQVLGSAVERAAAVLAAELQAHIAQLALEIVGEAIADEVARLRDELGAAGRSL